MIAECTNCQLRFTQDAPAIDSIAPYYKSEDYISHTNTSKGVVNRVYHWVRKRTISAKRKLVQQKTGKDKGTLLDVGSGTGFFVNEMNEHQWAVTGLEPDADARKIARELYGLELKDTSELFELPVAHFDAITLWHVLEHVHKLHEYVLQMKVLLAEKGKLFIAVPNYTAKDAAIYGEYWAAYDVPRHLYHFSPRSMALLMEMHGLKIKQYLPMWYDSFYISLMSSKYKNAGKSNAGKIGWVSSMVNGLRSNLGALSDSKKCSSVIYVISK